MAHSAQEISALKSAQAALLDFSRNPQDPAAFEACAALLAPPLFKGRGAFFDHLCSHARDSAPAELAPAIIAFMDRLCGHGGFERVEGEPERVWRSLALLCELHPEDGLDDPSFLTGLEPLRRSLAQVFGIDEQAVALSPIALDLREASLGFSHFQWAMLPTQLGAIDPEALARDNPNEQLAAGRAEPARLWKALMVSCAFEAGFEPADFVARLRRKIGEGAEFSCAYAISGEERSAILVAKEAREPFSCLAFGFEPERWEIEADLARLDGAFGNQMARMSAFLEPILIDVPTAQGGGAGDLPLDSFALSICAADGTLLDALWLPARPESVALVQRLLEDLGLPLRMSEPSKLQMDAQGRRLWRTSLGRSPFDVDVWRLRVLGAPSNAPRAEPIQS